MGLVGAAVTMLARRATRRAMYDERGEPKLPRAARKSNSVVMLLIVAAASGVALALGDVLHDHRKELTEAT